MKVEVQCPNPDCGRRYLINSSRLAHEARCEQCGRTFIAESAIDTSAPVGQPSLTKGPAAPEPPPVQLPPIQDGLATTEAFHEEPLPEQIGRFTIRRRLGTGAFGEVYLAHDPVLDREVALKVPRATSRATPGAQARFLREPKAAARLRHPHIVAVHDAGFDGRQYYIASEYIPGRTLSELIDRVRPDFEHTAEIIRTLAEALDYAHRMGIVHRDVKPGNIMVDAQGQAHLMDFGLAQMEHSAEPLTQDGAVMGTAAYMATEQVDPAFGEVGPASDQYALGVILYELLCGGRPFDGPTQVILFNVLHQRPESPRAKSPDVPADLETICLKAMSKQPADRYASCGELAEDLRRWLADEPIWARRMGPVERSVRWCRRNPMVASLCATIAMLLIAVATIATNAYFREADLRAVAIRDRDIARQKEKEAKEARDENARLARVAKQDRDAAEQAARDAKDALEKLQDALAKLEKQRDRAERMSGMARDAVDRYFTKVSQNPRLKAVGLESLRKELLDTAREFYERFIQEYPNDPGLQAELARAHLRLAVITGQLGQNEEAVEQCQQAQAIFQQFYDTTPEDPDYATGLAECHSTLGDLYWVTRELDKARQSYESALTRWAGLSVITVADSPVYATCRSGEARAHNSLGLIHWAKRDFEEAERAYTSACNIWEGLREQDAKNPEYGHELAGTYNNLGVIYWAIGQSTSARETCHRARAIWQHLVALHPRVPEYRSGLAGVYNSLHALYQADGDLESAMHMCSQAISILDDLARKHPDVPQYQNDLARTHTSLGVLYEAKAESLPGETAEQAAVRDRCRQAAKAEYEIARVIHEDLVHRFPDLPEYQSCLARTHNRLGLWHAAAGLADEAARSFEAAAQMYEELHRKYPEVFEYLTALGTTWQHMGNLHRDRGDDQAALACYDKAVPKLEESYRKLPEAASVGSMPLPGGTAMSPLLRIDQVIGAFTPTAMVIVPRNLTNSPGLTGGGLSPLTLFEGMFRRALGLPAWIAASRPAPPKPDDVRPRPTRPRPPPDPSPGHAAARLALRDVHRDRAELYEAIGQFREALVDWDRVIRYDAEFSRPVFHLRRALARARIGNHVLAKQDADSVIKDIQGNGPYLYHAARVYALAAAAARNDVALSPDSRGEHMRSYGNQAMVKLRAARDAGFFSNRTQIEAFRDDADFASLRDRDDYREFLPD